MTLNAHTRLIRPATVNDAADLAQLSGELGYPVTPEVMRERLRNVFSRSGELVLLAEHSASEVVGWIHGSQQELLESGSRCEILGLVVKAEHRGSGIGRELVEALERWAIERGLPQISVRSNVLRTESHQFYERLGYARAKTQHAYRKTLGSTA
jgi:ribosomal protein S18 acetylase RimI-like enzyme